MDHNAWNVCQVTIALASNKLTLYDMISKAIYDEPCSIAQPCSWVEVLKYNSRHTNFKLQSMWRHTCCSDCMQNFFTIHQTFFKHRVNRQIDMWITWDNI